MTARELTAWAALVATSVGLHAVGFAKLAAFDLNSAVPAAKKPTFVDMSVAPKPAPPPPAPEPAPRRVARPAHRLAAAVPVKAVEPARAAEPKPAEAPPEPETPADFSGTTLTNDGPGPGWASATGTGASMHGPIGRPGARVTGRRVVGEPGPAPRPAGPATVELADLSRPPEPPALEEALERSYPADARQRGQGGKAVVRARISAEGLARDIVLVSESAPGFGQACQATLAGSRWTPPLDREGRPVSTHVQYTCRFEVR